MTEPVPPPRQDNRPSTLSPGEESIGRELVDAAILLHRELGPGLMETVYEAVLQHELKRRGLNAERQVPIGFTCRGMRFQEGFRADLLIEDCVLVELKSLERIHNAHRKQLLTYLKLTGLRLGFLLNFGESLMKEGITRVINSRPDS